jgi:hypothetical protein
VARTGKTNMSTYTKDHTPPARDAQAIPILFPAAPCGPDSRAALLACAEGLREELASLEAALRSDSGGILEAPPTTKAHDRLMRAVVRLAVASLEADGGQNGSLNAPAARLDLDRPGAEEAVRARGAGRLQLLAWNAWQGTQDAACPVAGGLAETICMAYLYAAALLQHEWQPGVAPAAGRGQA